jgi:hypothetical protein
MLDRYGKLFYLPMPRLVELEEAVASQQFGAICLGGDRSSGKSVGLRALMYRYCQKIENFASVLLRRDFPQLELNHMRFMERDADRLGATFSAKSMKFHETGALLRCGHCHARKDYESYIGGDLDLITFVQLEQFEREQFTEIAPSTGRIRRDDWRGLVLAEENPGGPLSAFVEELFVEKNPDPKEYPDYNPADHHFIRTQLDDNPWTDPRYVNKLANMTYERREMMRFGRRDIFPNQYFKRFRHPKRVQRLTALTGSVRICALHWAYQRQGIFIWALILPDGRLYVDREYPFSETRAADVAVVVLGLSKAANIPIVMAWGNPPKEIPESEHGEDIFETLFLNGLPVIRSDHDPIAGWQRLQHWLQPVENSDEPALIISPDCALTIRTLPQLIQSQTNAEDVDESGAIAAARALRYLVMSRPAVPQASEKPSGRDLSKMDERTRTDIERLARIEAEEAKPLVSFFPFSSE